MSTIKARNRELNTPFIDHGVTLDTLREKLTGNKIRTPNANINMWSMKGLFPERNMFLSGNSSV